VHLEVNVWHHVNVATVIYAILHICVKIERLGGLKKEILKHNRNLFLVKVMEEVVVQSFHVLVLVVSNHVSQKLLMEN